jgi:hypothetical protein
VSRGHTRGPWTLTHKHGSNFAVQCFEIRGMFGDSPNVSPIFNKSTSAIDGALIYASPEDARLIAAAPELLAALENLTANILEAWPALEPLGPIIAAKAAIEKATGSQVQP